jgi:Prokaryotic lipoprotein-attachment site
VIVRVLMLLALTAVLAGCGNKSDTRTVAQTEGIYLDVGELKYQVQMSRILNPNDIEDAAYLAGLPAGSQLPGNEAWFGVWIRVENTNSDKALPTASQFTISDTQGNEFKPVPLQKNPFAYAPSTLGPKSVSPNQNSVAGEGVQQGSLILFKLTTDSIANRPLEFKITNPANPANTGRVDLDV